MRSLIKIRVNLYCRTPQAVPAVAHPPPWYILLLGISPLHLLSLPILPTTPIGEGAAIPQGGCRDEGVGSCSPTNILSQQAHSIVVAPAPYKGIQNSGDTGEQEQCYKREGATRPQTIKTSAVPLTYRVRLI